MTPIIFKTVKWQYCNNQSTACELHIDVCLLIACYQLNLQCKIFSHYGILMHPHRARVSNDLPEIIIFLKRNLNKANSLRCTACNVTSEE